MNLDQPTRSATVWCPDWPIVAGNQSALDPVAVVHANRVVAASSAARGVGVARGQRRREAQARCPALVILERDQAGEARAFEQVVGSLDSLTPRVEIVRPGLVVFPTLGPSRYFGGDMAMATTCVSLIEDVLDQTGVARVGIADGAFGATLAARCATETNTHVVPEGDSPAFLAPFPISTLDRPEFVGVLSRLGLTSLGAFADLSVADVTARFGADGEVAHRLARGLDERPPAVEDPPPEMEVAQELDPPVDRVDHAAFMGKVLADQFLQKLDSRGATCTRIVVVAETEHGETLTRYWRNEGSLTAAAVADRVRWQLDGWLNGSSHQRPSGGLTRLAVRPDDLVAAKGRQLGFWGGQREDAERAARVIARIQGLLGPEAVRVPERRGGRSPHEQIVTVQADAVDLSRPSIDGQAVLAPWPGALPGPTPARLHQPALEAQIVNAQGVVVRVDGRAQLKGVPCKLWTPHGQWQQISTWAGPWPLDERWWDNQKARRRARLQVVTESGVAYLVVAEGGHWWVEATYD